MRTKNYQIRKKFLFSGACDAVEAYKSEKRSNVSDVELLVRDGEGNHLQRRDEEWILKDRAALSKAGPPQSRFSRVRTALMNAYQVVTAQLGKSLGRRTRAEPPRPVAVPGAVSKQEGRVPHGALLELRKASGTQPISKSPSPTRKTAPAKPRAKRLG